MWQGCWTGCRAVGSEAGWTGGRAIGSKAGSEAGLGLLEVKQAGLVVGLLEVKQTGFDSDTYPSPPSPSTETSFVQVYTCSCSSNGTCSYTYMYMHVYTRHGDVMHTTCLQQDETALARQCLDRCGCSGLLYIHSLTHTHTIPPPTISCMPPEQYYIHIHCTCTIPRNILCMHHTSHYCKCLQSDLHSVLLSCIIHVYIQILRCLITIINLYHTTSTVYASEYWNN